MIGIFDSGVGGMTVARAIEQRFPAVSTLYLGDLARTPYGPKSEEAILAYSLENAAFLVERGAKLLVIACNSAASVAANRLRSAFKVPVVEVISPAVDAAVEASRSGRIGVIGTRATIRSNIYPSLITEKLPESKVYSAACPLLVPLVEEGWLNSRETKMIVRKYLHPLKDKQIDSLILGCTHYPLLKDLIQPRIGKNVKLIDSAQAVCDHLASVFAQHPEVTAGDATTEHVHYVTDVNETAGEIAGRIYQREIELIKV